jgi:5-methylcytosine-specific restriction enzyme A
MSRHEFTVAIKLAAWTRAHGTCENCGLPFRGRRPEYHHIRESFFGGAATLENCLCICVPCHKWFTSQAAPRMAKTRMQEKAAAGIKPKGRPMPGSRASSYKIRLTSRGARTERRI